MISESGLRAALPGEQKAQGAGAADRRAIKAERKSPSLFGAESLSQPSQAG